MIEFPSRITKYDRLLNYSKISPDNWHVSCTHSECTFHQLSPYIGKLKSTIADELVLRFSQPNDIVADVFSGSGTIPLEAAKLSRRVYASDVSPYAMTLTQGKLFAPDTLEEALERAEKWMEKAIALPAPDLRSVPSWVRSFFHPRTLKEAINFSIVARHVEDHFLLSCFLGILHHQRPGFLSFPSSHLVPYLRDKKFPKSEYPELYKYRPLRSRLLKKITRAYKRPPAKKIREKVVVCHQKSVQELNLPENLDCLITSPPYMNALDYGRDNRLRLWFLGEHNSSEVDRISGGFTGFQESITALAYQLQNKLKPRGYCVFVVGEKDTRRTTDFPSRELTRLLELYCPSLRLLSIIPDEIPDIRRSRRGTAGIKKEHILVFQKD